MHSRFKVAPHNEFLAWKQHFHKDIKARALTWIPLFSIVLRFKYFIKFHFLCSFLKCFDFEFFLFPCFIKKKKIFASLLFFIVYLLPYILFIVHFWFLFLFWGHLSLFHQNHSRSNIVPILVLMLFCHTLLQHHILFWPHYLPTPIHSYFNDGLGRGPTPLSCYLNMVLTREQNSNWKNFCCFALPLFLLQHDFFSSWYFLPSSLLHASVVV
jgi:hypothetical protein